MNTRTEKLSQNRERTQRITAGIAAAVIAACTIPFAAINAQGDELKPGADQSAQPAIAYIAQGAFSNNQDAYWELSESGVLSVTGSGAIEYEEAIAQYAARITSIYICKDITSIGTDTFSLLPELRNVAFEEDSNLKQIGLCAFYSCQCLESVTLPPSVKTIGSAAFSTCYSLKYIDLGGETSKLETIGASAFSNCESISNITLPQTLKNVEAYAFTGCTSLTDIHIPASVESIQQGAFEDCSGLKQAAVEDKDRTQIEQGAFSNTPFSGLETQTKDSVKTQSVSIKNLKVLGKRKLRVSWKQVTGAKSYTVKYKKTKAKHYKKLVIRDAAKKKAILKNLKTGKRYRVYVTANAKKSGKELICASGKRTSKQIK